MTQFTIGINPTTDGAGTHDPSAVLFGDERLLFGVEEERFTRQKHAVQTFPENAIRACLNYRGLTLSDVDKVMISWIPKEKAKTEFQSALTQSKGGITRNGYQLIQSVKTYSVAMNKLRDNLASLGTPVPPIETANHHLCHAMSAFYPSGFNEALVLTVDGRGESDTTVVWKGDENGIHRIRTYRVPNSLGGFYGAVTEFLGYRINNGEGKVMGLAPYGERNSEIERRFRELVDTGVDYDVSRLVQGGIGDAIDRLENTFERPQKSATTGFTDWEKDFAHVAQKLLEEIVVDIVTTYCREFSLDNLCLAGGVALNCKMNKRVMELNSVDRIFVQPVANDAGTAIGAGMLGAGVSEPKRMSSVYWGPEYSMSEIEETLRECKLDYSEPEDLERSVAERIADGKLVGWFQGQLEMGPRALGNRSILADPRSIDSRDRVNEFVKHREEWRPFAPSMLEEAIDDYLVNAEPSPYMIKTFDVKAEKRDEVPAILHAADDTTRPQTVSEHSNPRYYRLIRKFEQITGVPMVLNTSFNDHGEPIVNTPAEAVKDFYGMGLDVLVIEDKVLEKDARMVAGAPIASK